MSIRIEDVLTTPNEIHVGQSARVEWRVTAHAHIELVRWVTLFPGVVDERTTSGPDGIGAIFAESDEGAFSCTYTHDEKLVCLTDPVGTNGRLEIDVAGMDALDLTVRACVEGIDGQAEANEYTACDFRTVSLTLK